MRGNAMKEESLLESKSSAPEITKEGPALRRRNVVNGFLLFLGVLLVLGFGLYLAVIAISKDGF
jgi:hypothetical protein